MPCAVPSSSSSSLSSIAAAAAAAASASSASEPTPEPTQGELLRAFFAAQQRRRAHWAEYDEAFAALAASASPGAHPTAAAPEHAAEAGACGCVAASHVAAPLREQDLPRILALITAGLLDASHEVRTCATALRSLSSSSSSSSSASASASSAPARHCAELLDAVQDAENAVLRAIVARDSARRDKVRDRSEEIAQCEREVGDKRRDIEELCAEVRAEMAELEE
ncbi:hypothetical protein FA09DRAFT_329375 [Tilletiopsis washingtonensis]|uniref:Uncharacterized protein n=1 Tax=Tilletiopsis washingtonensis TaxID=58919 RepID=A0A316ZEX9_9BASI|nr:hypothetical protein FA09DRAFT_329375 [Tilletiopsis washingtonensis]PWN98895.1 hypothetical protein FA09DRAFT_329375 [Tilletiopsis washingtonensis]